MRTIKYVVNILILCRLLERLDVMLPLNANQFLVPSRLSSDAPSLIRPCTSSLLRRVYVLAYVPMGFWAHLIARLLPFIPLMGKDNEPTPEQQVCETIECHCHFSLKSLFISLGFIL